MSIPLIPELEGLDSKDALARLAGNRSLYVKLLRQFLSLEVVPQQCAAALAGDDRPTAERLAHSLKGAAAGVGAVAVRQAALDLELSLEEAALTRLQIVLSDFIQRLRAALPPEQTAAAQVTPDDIVSRLDAHLAEFDVTAVETVQAHRHRLRELLGADGFGLLEQQIADYAFLEARATLRRMAAEKEITLP